MPRAAQAQTRPGASWARPHPSSHTELAHVKALPVSWRARAEVHAQRGALRTAAPVPRCPRRSAARPCPAAAPPPCRSPAAYGPGRRGRGRASHAAGPSAAGHPRRAPRPRGRRQRCQILRSDGGSLTFRGYVAVSAPSLVAPKVAPRSAISRNRASMRSVRAPCSDGPGRRSITFAHSHSRRNWVHSISLRLRNDTEGNKTSDNEPYCYARNGRLQVGP